MPELSLPKKTNGKKATPAVTRQSQSATAIVKKNGETELTDDFLLAEELRKTLVALWQGDKPAISPQSLFQVWGVAAWGEGWCGKYARTFCNHFATYIACVLSFLLVFYQLSFRL